jgi:fructose-1,6-bisphosphatase/inositol monophosphatase family enzyme
MTHVAINAVQRALELARRGVGATVTAAKGGRDLVTATDVAVEDAVRGIVRAAVGAVVVGESVVASLQRMTHPTGFSIPSAGPEMLLPEFSCTV